MFQEWGFLISEMLLLIILAALLGLLVGWLIWGRLLSRRTEANTRLRADLKKSRAELEARKADLEARKAELEARKAELEKCRADGKARQEELVLANTRFDGSLAAAKEKNARVATLERKLEKAEALAKEAKAGGSASAAEPVAVAAAPDADAKDYDGDGVIEGTDEGVKPATLSEARGGQPDDLKQIKGIGPKLELLCHELGFFHFDQVAAWTADEVAWVDANLQGFKGRVSRDNWVEQAKVLAAGGTTEFAQKVKKGDVYD